ncbi:MAG TPA: EAL domain-containing protein [Noviherbaspirillum sp.]|jgi:diguanylate cyclase (GGDEF)-like protein/PAS domain S-box-containing protein|uniref:EAL domain-containing protein n=1 Tax=Noviherbaspirillum sp. TaxID=1926288 RepID=UPI002F947B96
MPALTTLDDVPALAARLCGAPAALLVFLDQHRQWHRHTVGLPPLEGKGGTCFCAQAICGKTPYVVADAAADPLFAGERLLEQPWEIRFYAGIPLHSTAGMPLGTLAVLDHVPRKLDEGQLNALEMLASHVLTLVQLDEQQQQLAQARQERERMGRLLRERTVHLETVQRLTSTGGWELSLPNGRLQCSGEIYRIFGIERAGTEDDVNTFMQLIHPEDRERVLLAEERLLKGRAPLDVEFRIRRPDGGIRYLHMRGEMRTAGGGTSLSGTVQDISARRASAEQLHLLETSIARLNDMVMITEAGPVDEPGPRIVFVNPAFERLTGYSREEVIGRSPRLLQGPRTGRAELDRMRAAIIAREPVCVEVLNYKKNGEEFWVELDLVPVFGARGRATHYVAVQRDITERKLRTLELERTTRALQLLRRCNETLVRAEEESDLLNRICQLAVDIGGYDFAWVGLVREDARKSIRPVAYAGKLGDVEKAMRLDVRWAEDSASGKGPTGTVVREQRAVVCTDVWEEPSFSPWLEWVRSEGFRGLIALPLMRKGKVSAVLSLYLRSVREFSDDEVRLMQDLASDVSFGVSHLRSQRRQRRLEEAILQVATSVSASTGTEFLEQLARNMAGAVGAQAGVVARLLPGEPARAGTIVAVVDGRLAENFEYEIRGTPCERLLAEHSFLVDDEVAGTFPQSPWLHIVGASAYVGSLLADAAGRPVGLLYVLFREPLRQRDFVLSMFRIFAARVSSELERQLADARIRDQASLLDKAQDAIIVCDAGQRITYWNKSAERLYGWSAEEALGRTMQSLLSSDPGVFDLPMQTLGREGEWRGELRQRRKDRSKLLVEAHWNLIAGDGGEVQSILAIHTDIGARKEAEEKVQQLAFYDQLTRLPNRSSLMERLQRALAGCRRNRRSGALMLIDLDNFKTLNDTLGHDKGDLLLQQVAKRLSSCVRQTDTVARLGGDEFVVLLEDLGEAPDAAALQAEATAEKILAALNQPYRLEAYEHVSTPSIGVTLFPSGMDASAVVDDLLKRADLAMYQAKAAGRNAIRFFDPVMQAAVKHRLGLEADLRHATRANEFVLYYQAQVDRNGRQTGAEALIRWEQPRRGLVPPAEFIPLAEETGLILRLGEWVLETACSLLAQWETDPHAAHMTMSVNVSARQFRHPDFVALVLDVLERTGADPGRLKLELTESLLVDDIETTIAKMSALKERGVGFSLDDFGTGYSSLSYLKRFPLDQLKIDQSFVRDVLVDPNDAAIARTIVALGQSLGLSVIAEGVETEAQRDFLAQQGCHAYQGYLYSEPAPAVDFLNRLRPWGAITH